MLNQLFPDPLLTFNEIRRGLAIASITTTIIYAIIMIVRIKTEITNHKQENKQRRN